MANSICLNRPRPTMPVKKEPLQSAVSSQQASKQSAANRQLAVSSRKSGVNRQQDVSGQ